MQYLIGKKKKHVNWVFGWVIEFSLPGEVEISENSHYYEYSLSDQFCEQKSFLLTKIDFLMIL